MRPHDRTSARCRAGTVPAPKRRGEGTPEASPAVSASVYVRETLPALAETPYGALYKATVPHLRSPSGKGRLEAEPGAPLERARRRRCPMEPGARREECLRSPFTLVRSRRAGTGAPKRLERPGQTRPSARANARARRLASGLSAKASGGRGIGPLAPRHRETFPPHPGLWSLGQPSAAGFCAE